MTQLNANAKGPSGILVQRREVMANLENARGLHQIRIEIAHQELI